MLCCCGGVPGKVMVEFEFFSKVEGGVGSGGGEGSPGCARFTGRIGRERANPIEGEGGCFLVGIRVSPYCPKLFAFASCITRVILVVLFIIVSRHDSRHEYIPCVVHGNIVSLPPRNRYGSCQKHC